MNAMALIFLTLDLWCPDSQEMTYARQLLARVEDQLSMLDSHDIRVLDFQNWRVDTPDEWMNLLENELVAQSYLLPATHALARPIRRTFQVGQGSKDGKECIPEDRSLEGVGNSRRSESSTESDHSKNSVDTVECRDLYIGIHMPQRVCDLLTQQGIPWLSLRHFPIPTIQTLWVAKSSRDLSPFASSFTALFPRRTLAHPVAFVVFVGLPKLSPLRFQQGKWWNCSHFLDDIVPLLTEAAHSCYLHFGFDTLVEREFFSRMGSILGNGDLFQLIERHAHIHLVSQDPIIQTVAQAYQLPFTQLGAVEHSETLIHPRCLSNPQFLAYLQEGMRTF